MEDFQLKEDVIFYKFNKTTKTARKMCEKYPPNKKQRRICDRLLVPHLSWSFFEGEILKHGYIDLAHKLYPLGEIYTIKIPDIIDFRDMNLNQEEKMFISHHEALEKIRRNSVCVSFAPSCLVELCMKVIVRRTDLRGLEEGKWGSLLPETLYQQLSLYKQNIESWNVPQNAATSNGKSKIVRVFDVRSAINLFNEKDRKFSKDFADWFQNDDSICFEEFKNSHRLVLIRFKAEDLYACYSYFWYCFECMRRKLRGYRIINYFARTYKIRDVTFFDCIRERCDYWCHDCKQVPLFQILSLQEFDEQYGKRTLNIENELFI